MRNQFIARVVLVFLLAVPVGGVAIAQDNLPRNLYVAGFVFDEHGEGVSGAEIVVEHKNRKLFSLRSTEAGWYESTKPVPVDYLDQVVRLTVLKRGYRLQSQNHILKTADNFVVFHLKPIVDVPNYGAKDALATGVFYGYVSHPSQDSALSGAKATLKIDGKDIDVSFSRDSGYFTLNYPIKYFNQPATLVVEHPRYQTYEENITLSPQTTVKKIPDLKEKTFAIDWLVRESVVLATNDTPGGFSPFKYELNYLKLMDLLFFNDELYDPTAAFVWTFSGGAYETRRSNVSYVQAGGVFKPLGPGQKTKFSMDFSLGFAMVKDNDNRSQSKDSIHLQLGANKYFGKSKESTTMANPHMRTEVSAIREHDEWRFLWLVGLGL
jgi:hypothetical protein